MTKQEIFDVAARHLLAQGRPAFVAGQCSYRAEDGTKCAVGVLIPDDKYNPDFEGDSVDGPVRHFLVESGLIDELELLRDLQSAHDDPAFSATRCANWIEEWKLEMLKVAAKHELDASVLG